MERVINRPAHAKINPFLRVLRRRDDDYHDIESLVLPVSLADDVAVRQSPELRLTVRGELADAVPLGEDNLVMRAARALSGAAGVEEGADIELTKRVPVAAGLGGGSADAAATMLALDELWGCGFKGEELLSFAAAVGSDVPALLHGGPVIVRGRGEIVEPVDVKPSWWVLVPMSFGVLVGDAYEWWADSGMGSGFDFLPVLAASEGRLDRVAGALFNVLEAGVAARHIEILAVKRELRELGALATIMCGSGPTVAGLVPDEREAQRIADAMPGSVAVSAP